MKKEADEKCRNQNGCKKKDKQFGNESGWEEKQDLGHTAQPPQPPEKSENV